MTCTFCSSLISFFTADNLKDFVLFAQQSTGTHLLSFIFSGTDHRPRARLLFPDFILPCRQSAEDVLLFPDSVLHGRQTQGFRPLCPTEHRSHSLLRIGCRGPGVPPLLFLSRGHLTCLSPSVLLL